MRIVNECPEVVTVFYSKLEGGSHIPPHAGYLKGVLRYHLGIRIPEPHKTWIVVNGQKVHWTQGKSILFDDMYLHEVHHTGQQIRSIVWLDVVRNDLNVYPWLKWWILKLVTIVANSHWMQQANAQAERVHKSNK